MAKLVVIGSINTDLVIRVPHLPHPGETVLGGQFATFAGGKGANQAVAAARAGAEVTFVGCVGDDALGRERLADLRAEGIDSDGVATVAGDVTGTGLIMIDQGSAENQIAVASGANDRVTPAQVAALDFAAFAAVVLQHEIPQASVAEALRRAHAAGCTTILNPAPAAALAHELAPLIDVLIPNQHELAVMAGGAGGVAADDDSDDAQRVLVERAQTLIARGVKRVLVTRGARGATLVEAGGAVEHFSASRAQAVDTVGAGDCFVGNLAARLAMGSRLADAVCYATRAAAISVTRHGAQASMPTRGEVDWKDKP